MTAKDYVKSKMPKAKAERHTSGKIAGLKETYWLIRNGNENMYFAQGKTESNAWVKAKERIIEQDKKLI